MTNYSEQLIGIVDDMCYDYNQLVCDMEDDDYAFSQFAQAKTKRYTHVYSVDEVMSCYKHIYE